MAKIIQFSQVFLGRLKKIHGDKDLTEFLREAHQKIPAISKLENQQTINPAMLRHLLTAKMMHGILRERKISVPSFLCGVYAAKVLADFLRTTKEKWWCIDRLEKFAETGNPFFYQDAGDYLFRICAVFPESLDRPRRPLKLADYLQMGASCYQTFYHLTGKEIGYHMSRQFQPIAKIANQYAVRSWK